MSGVAVGLLVLAALTVGFALLARRALRLTRAFVRWPGVIVAGLLALVCAALTVVGGLGLYRLAGTRVVALPPASVSVAGQAGPELVARGAHVAKVACAHCHSENGDLPMSGGSNMSEETGLPLGDVYGPNLTPGGVLRGLSDEDLFRVIRTGIGHQRRATVMAMLGARHLSDEDIRAVIAQLRASPAVEKQKPPFRPTVLLALFIGAGFLKLETPASVGPVVAPPKAATQEYGRYVFEYMGCADCHGPKLDGEVPPPTPPGPDLRDEIRTSSAEAFLKRMRGGPSGSVMPWESTAILDDVELEALLLQLKSVAAAR